MSAAVAVEILADREIVGVNEAFAGLGRLRLFDGRNLTPAELGQAEILLVRSVTRVGEGLLAGSRIRFVGTATAGTDHIDTAALTRLGIAFADAPGCNARAVAEHVVVCLYQYAAARGRRPQECRVGIVGHGHVGRTLAALLSRLGSAYLVNDPPLAALGLLADARPLHEILACDVVTLHVPLTATGPSPTRHLIDAAAIAALPVDSLLINAARGGVIDERALCARLREGLALTAAIDCWVGEPRIDGELLGLVKHATPHIAGHTLEARLTATRQLHAAVQTQLGQHQPYPVPAPPRAGMLRTTAADLAALLSEVHPLTTHTARLQALGTQTSDARGAEFDALRRRHGLRREFAAYDVASTLLAPDTVAELGALGFACA